MQESTDLNVAERVLSSVARSADEIMQVLGLAARNAVEVVVISGRIDSENQLITRNSLLELSNSHAECIAWLEQRLDEDKTSVRDLMRLHHLEIDQHFQSQNAQLDRIESGLTYLTGGRRRNQSYKTSAFRCLVGRLLWAQRVIDAFEGKKYRRYERLKILTWLSNIPYQQHHSQVHDKFQEGTGLWFLHDDVYKEWRDSRESSFLWLHGPGCGESKLT